MFSVKFNPLEGFINFKFNRTPSLKRFAESFAQNFVCVGYNGK